MDGSSIDRRSVLQMAAAGADGVSGRSAFSEGSDPAVPELIELIAASSDRESHTFHLRFELDGQTVYQAAEQVEAASPDDSRGAVSEGYPEDSKPYVLSAWTDGDESTTRTFDFTSLGTECLGVHVFYGWYKEPPNIRISRSTRPPAVEPMSDRTSHWS